MGPLSLNETDEIVKVSSSEQKYTWNLNTLKVNDLNFDQMNTATGQNRYVVLGNQVQLSVLSEIGLQSFYLYVEFLGSLLPQFSSSNRSLVVKDGLQIYRFTTDKWVQFDTSENKLNYHVLPTDLRQLDATLDIERFSGIVTAIHINA